ncbi:ABC transporter ATP-binding protein [Propionibacterium sp.]|uniref:ABC transporter ATP-binding protein n=1 Tax=Propionibacterium sp. TaxID=1977903 RepID=UPI0039E89CF6
MRLHTSHLYFGYGKHSVLKDINLDLSGPGLVCLLGPNGVGKSTLFGCLLGSLKDYQGAITIDDEDLGSYTAAALARRIAFVPQAQTNAFGYSVVDMVLMATAPMLSVLRTPGKPEELVAMEALERVHMTHLARRDFATLSGGEKQLVLIARGLAQQSPIVIMDEPTASLDYGNQLRVLQVVRALADTDHLIICSTHNPDQALQFGDRAVALKDGAVCGEGPPVEVVNERLLKDLYGVDVQLTALPGSPVPVCVPRFLTERFSDSSVTWDEHRAGPATSSHKNRADPPTHHQ